VGMAVADRDSHSELPALAVAEMAVAGLGYSTVTLPLLSGLPEILNALRSS
jgi:hypothetical protein